MTRDPAANARNRSRSAYRRQQGRAGATGALLIAVVLGFVISVGAGLTPFQLLVLAALPPAGYLAAHVGAALATSKKE